MIIINEGKSKSFPLRGVGVIQIPPGESDHPDNSGLAEYVTLHPDLSLGSIDEAAKPEPAPVEKAPEPKKRKRKSRTEVEDKPKTEPSEDSDGTTDSTEE